ncbi:Ferredoxin-like protein, FixX family, partial [hydrothermal vent metagenome]
TDEIGGSHLVIKDPAICETCVLKQCLYVCPCAVYELNENSGQIEVNYEACVECGTCRIACDDNIEWRYPRGGFGIAYKFG